MKHILLFFSLSTIGLGSLAAQTIPVWPGDANNNGLVNNVDFLQLGLGYNTFGPERSVESTAWQAQAATPWSLVLGNGVNAAYADANGDGLVNYYYDAFPIYVHYGLTHGTVAPDVFPAGVPGVDAPLYLDSSASPVQVFGGSTLHLPLMLGSSMVPVEDLYGLAFSIHVDPQFVDVDNIALDFNQPSWANPDNDRIYFTRSPSASRLDVGWVRTDHNMRSGFGPIGIADFIIIDNVVSLQQNFQIRIDSIQMIDRFGNKTAVAGDTLTVVILPSAQAASNEPDRVAADVWPNPAHDLLHLRAEERIQQATLFDALGRPVARLEPNKTSADWSLPGLPAGVYWLELRLEHGILRERILFR